MMQKRRFLSVKNRARNVEFLVIFFGCLTLITLQKKVSFNKVFEMLIRESAMLSQMVFKCPKNDSVEFEVFGTFERLV